MSDPGGVPGLSQPVERLDGPHVQALNPVVKGRVERWSEISGTRSPHTCRPLRGAGGRWPAPGATAPGALGRLWTRIWCSGIETLRA